MQTAERIPTFAKLAGGGRQIYSLCKLPIKLKFPGYLRLPIQPRSRLRLRGSWPLGARQMYSAYIAALKAELLAPHLDDANQ